MSKVKIYMIRYSVNNKIKDIRKKGIEGLERCFIEGNLLMNLCALINMTKL